MSMKKLLQTKEPYKEQLTLSIWFLKLSFCSPWRWYTCIATCWRCSFNICIN